jgi:hypothetical protein
MEVTPNAGLGSVQKVTGKPALTPRAKVAAADLASFRDAETLNRALQQAADIRPEVVQQARERTSGVEYPPLKTIQAISHLLAKKMGLDDDES